MAVELFSPVASMSLAKISLYDEIRIALSHDEFSLDRAAVPDALFVIGSHLPRPKTLWGMTANSLTSCLREKNSRRTAVPPGKTCEGLLN